MQRFDESEMANVDAAEKARGRLAHVVHIDVRWGDMDALGYVDFDANQSKPIPAAIRARIAAAGPK
jgi:hypothetical protein